MKAILGLLVVLAPVTALGEGTTSDRATVPTPTLLDCAKTPSISITQSSGSYKLVGRCDKVAVAGSMNVLAIDAGKNLSVTGSKNEITIGKVDKIAALGSLNRVTYGSGLSKPAPKVASIGKGNVVRKTPKPAPSEPAK